MPPPDHPDDEAKDDPWGDDLRDHEDEAPLVTPGVPGAAPLGLDVEGPAGEIDEPLELSEGGDDDRRGGLDGDDELDAGALDLVDEIPEERTLGGHSPAGLDDASDDDDPSFDDGPVQPTNGDIRAELDDALGIELVDEHGSGQDRGEEGTGEETELDESALPPLDADDEGDELSLVDPALERSVLGASGDDLWELEELAPGRFRCVAQSEGLVVAGGDALLVRATSGHWLRHELGEPVLACAVSGGRVAVCTPTRVLVASAGALSTPGGSSDFVEHRVDRATGLAFARGRACFVDRHGTLFELAESGQRELVERDVVAIASTAAGIVMVRRELDGTLLLERRRGDDAACVASALRLPISGLDERKLAAFASPSGDVALISGGRVAFSLGGGDRFTTSMIDGVLSAAFVVQSDSVCLAVASREPGRLVVRMPAERASAEAAATLPMDLGGEDPIGLVWDGSREAFLLATPQGLHELRRSPAH